MAVARKCEQCGRIDARVTWPSTGDAAKDPVFATLDLPDVRLDRVRPGRGGEGTRPQLIRAEIHGPAGPAHGPAPS